MIPSYIDEINRVPFEHFCLGKNGIDYRYNRYSNYECTFFIEISIVINNLTPRTTYFPSKINIVIECIKC